ncbi:hypothetical protein [Nostoc sp. TCL240-02]|nr:hypothetical protein [Nostoc sp. TCL240-02]
MSELNDDVVAMSEEFSFAHKSMTKHQDLIKALETEVRIQVAEY